MGTNFYIRGHNRSYSHHVGKRSAAGMYCWDCGITLCKEGNDGIHRGCRKSGPDHMFCRCDWHSHCPKCGKADTDEKLEEGAAGRELGFNQSPPKEKAGVASCSSFTWAMDPKTYIALAIEDSSKCPCCNREYDDQDKVIENEYGDLFTMSEFMDVLDECPIQYFNSIGKEFS